MHTTVWLSLVFLCVIQFGRIEAACHGITTLYHTSYNTIQSPNYPSYYDNAQNCEWHIVGPNPESRITLVISSVTLEKPQTDNNACYDYIRITSINDNGTLKSYDGFLCGVYNDARTVISSSHIMKVQFHSDDSRTFKGFSATFAISHTEITTTSTTTMATTKRPCTDAEFTCPNLDCIPAYNVCDGDNNCGDLHDENCWRAPWDAFNRNTILEKATKWFYQQVKSDWGWGDQTHRAVIALALRNRTLSLFGSDIFDQSVVFSKQLEVEVVTALLRNESLKTDQLALNILALRSVCFDAQNFYGVNLTEKITCQDAAEELMNPLVPLAICASNVDVPEHYMAELEDYLAMDFDSHFNLDSKASSLIALACAQKREQELPTNLTQRIFATLERFKSMQQEDGSFGDLATSALIGQALNAFKDNGTGWDYFKLISFLQSQQKESGVFQDFATTYLVVPVLAGRSLVDIMDISCQTRGRRAMVTSSTRQVFYSVWVGEDKGITYTTSLTYPYDPTITFFDLIKMASNQDSKFKATWKTYEWGPVIYSINGVYNMPEEQIYWRLFEVNNEKTLERYHQRLDRIFPENSHHYVMWLTKRMH